MTSTRPRVAVVHSCASTPSITINFGMAIRTIWRYKEELALLAALILNAHVHDITPRDVLRGLSSATWGRFPFVDAIYHGITQQSGNWVKHDGGACAARVAETIAFPYTPLLIELGLWLVAFHFVFFPFLQRCSQLILERRAKFWPQLNKKMSPYGITVAADAVWAARSGCGTFRRRWASSSRG